MDKNILFLTPERSGKEQFTEMIESTLHAITDSMDHGKAYAGMAPFDLRAALRSDEILPAEGIGFDAVLAEV